MSDSIKKYWEMVEDGLIKDEITRRDPALDLETVDEVILLNRARRYGLLVEVVNEALNEVRNNPQTSNLLALQIACKDWDV